MANIRLSGLLTSITGSIGGTTFQRSASGLTARVKPNPLKSKTNAQTQVRILQSRLNVEWLNLTDSQRQTWLSFAQYTNGYGLTNRGRQSANTGKMQFIAVNFWCLLYGKSIITTPTFSPPLDPCIPCPPYYDVSDNLMNYDGSLDTTQEILVTRVSMPQSVATATANTGFRTLVYAQIDGDQQNWTSAYLATFGISLVLGKKYWIELRKVNFVTGAISAPARKLVLYETVVLPLILSVDTTKAGSAANTFILRCGNTGTYNAVIDWGDGSQSTITTYNDALLSHTYATGGVYSISITGSLPWIRFSNSGDRLKLIDIVQWGSVIPFSLEASFYGCSNLIGSFTDSLDISNCTSLQNTFRDCTLFNGNIVSWDVSSITTMSNAFTNADSFVRDIGTWNISNVTNITMVFRFKTSVTQNISMWDVSNVTSAALFMEGSVMSTALYDALLNAWSLLVVKPNVVINFGGATTYTIATSAAARAILTGAPNNWIITDGGGI